VNRKHVGPEPWETAVWTIHDRLAEARQKQGKAVAQQLAEKALKAIEPQRDARAQAAG
jgi:hypothetical protein